MPPNHTMHFDPQGAPLQVRLVSGYAQRGNYFVELLDSTEVNVIERYPPGEDTTKDFSDPATDTFTLKTPPKKLAGTVLSVTANVLLLPPFSQATVSVTLLQPMKLGTASEDKSGSPYKYVEIDVNVALAAGSGPNS